MATQKSVCSGVVRLEAVAAFFMTLAVTAVGGGVGAAENPAGLVVGRGLPYGR
jgi:hypothetical protein